MPGVSDASGHFDLSLEKPREAPTVRSSKENVLTLPDDWRTPKEDGRDWIRAHAVAAERREAEEAEERLVLDRERQVHRERCESVTAVTDQRSRCERRAH